MSLESFQNRFILSKDDLIILNSSNKKIIIEKLSKNNLSIDIQLDINTIDDINLLRIILYKIEIDRFMTVLFIFSLSRIGDNEVKKIYKKLFQYPIIVSI